MPGPNYTDEQRSLAVVLGNTRVRTRSVDLLAISEALQHLTKCYGSQKAVSEKVGLSSEIIREFLCLLALPMEVQKLVRERVIDRLDIAYRIARLKRPEAQIEAAMLFNALGTKDVRDISRLASRGDTSLKESVRTVLESKLGGYHMFVIDLSEETYEAIMTASRLAKKTPAEFVRDIVAKWYESQTKPPRTRRLRKK